MFASLATADRVTHAKPSPELVQLACRELSVRRARRGWWVTPASMLPNKADRLDPKLRAELIEKHPDAVMLSAYSHDDVIGPRQRIIDHFEKSMVDAELVIPYAQQAVIAQVYENARVVSEDFNETGRKLVVRALPAAIAKLTRLVAPS